MLNVGININRNSGTGIIDGDKSMVHTNKDNGNQFMILIIGNY